MPVKTLVPLRPEPATTTSEGAASVVRPGKTAPGYGRIGPGFTGVVRVKDEAGALPWALPPLLRAARRVVLVDNGSTDGTPEIARAVAEQHGAAGRPEGHIFSLPNPSFGS